MGIVYPPTQERVFTLPNALEAKWNLTRDDLKKYYDIFLSVVDQDGNVPNEEATKILEQTLLPNKDLFVIWELSNRGSKKYFTPSEMIVAMHLSRGRLRNMPVGPTLPQELESFLSVSLEESFYMAGLPPPLIGRLGPGFHSGLFNTPPGTVASIAAASSGAWKLTLPDLKKYFESFKKLVTPEKLNILNKGGVSEDILVDAQDAASVFQKSELPALELALVWSLCDRDTDGKLNASEFIVALHLISCRRKGMTLPANLPTDLEDFIVTPIDVAFAVSGLPPPFEASKIAAARSYTQKDELAATDAPTFGSPVYRRDRDEDQLSFDPKAADKFSGASSNDRTPPPNFATTSNQPKFVSDAIEELRRKREHKDRIFESQLSNLPASGATSTTSPAGKSNGDSQWQDSSAALLEGLIEADRHMSKKIRREADASEQTRDTLASVTQALKDELVKEKKELERQLDRKSDFERQVEDLRLSLDEMKQQRHMVELNRVSLGRDLAHYQEEILFLRQQIEEGRKDIQLINDANNTLDKSYRNTENSIHNLDAQRKSILETVQQEKAQLKAEEAEIAQLKLTLERMRREKDNHQSRNSVLQEKTRQAEQDRSTLFTSLEAERAKLSHLRQDRISIAEEKLALAQEHNNLVNRAVMQAGSSALSLGDNHLISTLLSNSPVYPTGSSSSNVSPTRGGKQLEVYTGHSIHSWNKPLSGNVPSSKAGVVRDNKGVIASVGNFNLSPSTGVGNILANRHSDATSAFTNKVGGNNNINTRGSAAVQGGFISSPAGHQSDFTNTVPSNWTDFGETITHHQQQPGFNTHFDVESSKHSFDGARTSGFNKTTPSHLPPVISPKDSNAYGGSSLGADLHHESPSFGNPLNQGAHLSAPSF